MLRSFFPSSVKFNWIFGIVLILVFTSIRFYIVLEANVTRDYGNIAILFTIMALLPFFILNKEGRKNIGLKLPPNYLWLLPSFLIGMLICTITYFIFKAGYDHSISNSLVYISNSYRIETLNPDNKLIFFITFSISGMLFSPFGEEIFYRGLIHGSFVEKFGETNASRLDSLAFAIAHLSHFGIIYFMGGWSFLFIPAMIWMIAMYFYQDHFSSANKKLALYLEQS